MKTFLISIILVFVGQALAEQNKPIQIYRSFYSLENNSVLIHVGYQGCSKGDFQLEFQDSRCKLPLAETGFALNCVADLSLVSETGTCSKTVRHVLRFRLPENVWWETSIGSLKVVSNSSEEDVNMWSTEFSVSDIK